MIVNGPLLIASLMIDSHYILNWLDSILDSLWLICQILFWYYLLDAYTSYSSLNLRAANFILTTMPISIYVLFLTIYPLAIYMSNFTFDFFQFAPSYSITVAVGGLSVAIYVFRACYMIISGKYQ